MFRSKKSKKLKPYNYDFDGESEPSPKGQPVKENADYDRIIWPEQEESDMEKGSKVVKKSSDGHRYGVITNITGEEADEADVEWEFPPEEPSKEKLSDLVQVSVGGGLHVC